MLELTELTKRYNGSVTPAADCISLMVRDGEIFGFLGANGAGKTTTIQMITGILKPDSGSVRICGLDLGRQAAQAKRLFGYVPDHPSLYERLTGGEYLTFLADAYRLSPEKRKKNISHYTEFFEIAPMLSAPIRTYSHGMRQRLVLAGSLIHEPRVWILDEPFTGLDPVFAYAMKAEMRAQREKGTAVFFSTHRLENAEMLCDRIGILCFGRLKAVGTPEELRNRAGRESSLEEVFLRMAEQRE